MKKINDDEVRWGILGVGDVCEVKSAPAMNLVDNSRLAAVMRRNEEKVKDYAKRHQVPKWYTDADELIKDPEVNAIYIATPPYAHKELTLKAAAAGKPVYVEKPMAKTYAECQEMIAACDKAGVPLYVAYYRRALPHFLKIKSLIDEGAIGEVRHVSIQMNQAPKPGLVSNLDDNWRVNPDIAGGGYFYDLASHQLDFLDFALGPIKTATGISANQAGLYQAEDMVVAAVEFESGVLGNGSWCFSSSDSDAKDQTIIYGSKGSISYETFGAGNVSLNTDNEGRRSFEFSLPKHIQMPLIQLIVGDLLGTALSPSDGLSGSRANRILENIVGK
ncbi:gfo/Idh/MocA family oxidoreductase [Echinicola strongylocentroti]|uniref:Gfo/Idh/MocA family oxidoreductase n=1 Tax=Echinicola strongylocentroti TaxID=1795355 RepID=A0A2Z4IP30_9BACT|nr:Gfo/Idh/MocA family oxidoreductase [Echinicola strongylocentroti]AWW32655.1 gfo/Idh/MocA family oxidoreductase [Echinicola strongylocentroti]